MSKEIEMLKREFEFKLKSAQSTIESQSARIKELEEGIEFMRLNFKDIKRHDVDMGYYIKYIESLKGKEEQK